jgi:hypothetical protein
MAPALLPDITMSTSLRRIRACVGVAAVAVLLASPPRAAASQEEASLDDVVRASTVAAVGTVTARTPQAVVDDVAPIDVTIAVERRLRGSPGTTLTVRLAARWLFGEAVLSQYDADYAVGERVAVFAAPGDGGVLTPVGGVLGKYDVVGDQVVRGSASYGSVDAFAARVQSVP